MKNLATLICLGLAAAALAATPPPLPPTAGPPAAVTDFAAAAAAKRVDDERIAAAASGAADYRKTSYRSSDGLEIPAYLFKPRQIAGRAPAVIYVHGSQHGQFNSRAMPRVLAMVARGYVVLAPDYRSSSGYSREFYDAADYGGREIDDMIAARDFLAAMPAVDARRIAILGLSHGGYNTLMAIIEAPDKFAAGVDFFGPTDLVWRVTAPAGENPNAEPGDKAYFATMVGKSVEAAPELYRARSPRYRAAEIRTPLIILHGDRDSVVLLKESQWLVDALRAAGNQNFEFHVIRDGQHGYPEPAMNEAWNLALAFLARTFATASAPAD